MSANEFQLIRDYFTTQVDLNGVIKGIGDDAAILQAPADKQQVMTMDTLIAGVHFPVSTSPEDIACKSVAVNLSDIAAMGATPAWLMLSLSMPENDEDWLHRFSQTLLQSCERYGVQLIGGDTCKGPLSITIQATGFVDQTRCMRRDGAQSGDVIMVTGTLGDAALALKLFDTDEQLVSCLDRLNQPEPRVAFAELASEFCRCAIDISDGLLADLRHITDASSCGAEIELAQIPLSDAFAAYDFENETERLGLALNGGDDYELCLTVQPENVQSMLSLADDHKLRLTVIGKINDTGHIQCVDKDGQAVTLPADGYRHF